MRCKGFVKKSGRLCVREATIGGYCLSHYNLIKNPTQKHTCIDCGKIICKYNLHKRCQRCYFRLRFNR